jgi:broad specificity phosphatase PhoE
VDRRGFLLLAAAAPVRAQDALWSLLKGGAQVVLLRHGLTDPGVGDPPGFTPGDCATQRNLNAQGRQEAERLGEALRQHGVPVAAVLSSPWCRCLDTAQLAFERPAQVQPALSNLFGRHENAAAQVEQLRKLIVPPASGGNIFMVTHGSTVHALTAVSPQTAEMVILTPQGGGSFSVAGRLSAR